MISDIGAREGALTAQIEPYLKNIVGVNGSPNMNQHSKESYPHNESHVVDCRSLDEAKDLVNSELAS